MCVGVFETLGRLKLIYCFMMIVSYQYYYYYII